MASLFLFPCRDLQSHVSEIVSRRTGSVLVRLFKKKTL